MDELQASAGSRKHKSKRTSTIKVGNFMTTTDNDSFMRKKNEKTIFKILNNRKVAKKIVPTIGSKTERTSLSKGKNSSVNRQMFYPSSSNRAHLISTQRDLLHPSTYISQINADN